MKYQQTSIKSELLLASNTEDCGDELLTEGGCVWYAVYISALRTEVGVRGEIECYKSKQEADQEYWCGYEDQTELDGTIPLAQSDVGDKYE